MTLKIIRKKERLNSQWSELEVYMDGERVSSIYGNDSCEIKLKEETGELKVKQILSKAATKQVNSGDIVEVSNSPLVKIGFYLMPVILILLFVSSSMDLLNFWFLTAVVAAYITFLLSIKPLKVEVVGHMEDENPAKSDIMADKAG